MFLQDSQNRGPLRFTSMRLETGSRFGFYLRLGKCQGFGRQLVRAFEVLESSDVGFGGPSGFKLPGLSSGVSSLELGACALHPVTALNDLRY